MSYGEPSRPVGQVEYRFAPVPSQHREQSMRMILQAADAVPPHRALVLGAGRCDEIPLAALAEEFAAVELTDIDPTLLDQGIATADLPPPDRQKVHAEETDLIGITAAVVSACQHALQDAAGADEAIHRIADLVVAAEPMTPRPRHVDLIVASCVLSQLTFTLVQEVRRGIAERFPESKQRAQSDPILTQAFDKLTRRCESAFIDYLAESVAVNGRVYLSDTVQMCFVRLSDQGDWTTPGTWRMTKSLNLDDYLDERFGVLMRRRWNWVANPPQLPADEGRLYDVQAMILSRNVTMK